MKLDETLEVVIGALSADCHILDILRRYWTSQTSLFDKRWLNKDTVLFYRLKLQTIPLSTCCSQRLQQNISKGSQ